MYVVVCADGDLPFEAPAALIADGSCRCKTARADESDAPTGQQEPKRTSTVQNEVANFYVPLQTC